MARSIATASSFGYDNHARSATCCTVPGRIHQRLAWAPAHTPLVCLAFIFNAVECHS
jgi:hypothetical protein